MLSAVVLVCYEAERCARACRSDAPRASAISRRCFSRLITFVAGTMLIMSSATPALARRLAVLRDLVPLWALESSQLVSGVVGVLLLFVARGLLRRQDAAWWLTVALTAVSLLLSVTKGLAFVEAGVLTTLLALLVGTRRHFNRRTALFAEPFTAGWLISVAIVMMCAAWVMFFAYRNVPYRSDLWWQFAFDERASRSLRAMLAWVSLRRRSRSGNCCARLPGASCTRARRI